MAPGSWSLRLKPETPASVLNALDWTATAAAGLGHIIVYPARTDASVLSTTDLLGNAKYTGVLLKHDDRFTIGGAGLGWWLGDSGEKGPLIETAITNTAGSIATWMASLTPPSLNTGGTAGTGTTITASFQWVTYRRAIEAICTANAASALPGCGWWVTPNGKLNIGGPTDVYSGTTPVVIRKFSGRDASILGVSVVELDRAMDLYEYVSKVRANGPTSVGTYSAASGYKDINGNTASIITIIDVPTCPPGLENSAAQTEYNARNATRRAIRLTSDTYDLTAQAGSQLLTGAYVNVFDPELGLYDNTNQVIFQGQYVFPLRQQVLAQSWPIRNGYSVWFRNGDGTLTDLTDWFVPETAPASIDIGAPPRTLGNPAGIQGLAEVGQVGTAAENGAWTDYTPTIVQSAAVAKTVTRAKYRRTGSQVEVHVRVDMTAAGSAGNTVTISLPITAAYSGNVDIVGTMAVYDASAGQVYSGPARLASTTTVDCLAHNSGAAPVGSSPSFALASGDVVSCHVSYEASIT